MKTSQMKKLLSLMLLIVAVALATGCPTKGSSVPTLTPVVTSGSYSPLKGFSNLTMRYVNIKGDVMPAEYVLAMPFSEGLGFVFGKDGQTGFVDAKGHLVIDLSDKDWFNGAVLAGTFSEGMVLAYAEDNQAGYLDREGHLKIDFQYEWAQNFSEGVAAVQVNGKMGYIDPNGQTVIDLKFDEAGDFSEGLALVRIGTEYHVINKSGDLLFQLPGSPMNGKFSEGLLAIYMEESDQVGFVDTEGRMAIPARFQSALRFQEGLAAVKQGNRWGYINKDGVMIIDARFESAYPFLNGRAFVQEEGKWGIINSKGQYVKKPYYDKVESIVPEMLISLYIRDDYFPFSDLHEGFVARLAKDDEIYYVHRNGRIVPIKLDD
jgi:hypothetical protein